MSRQPLSMCQYAFSTATARARGEDARASGRAGRVGRARLQSMSARCLAATSKSESGLVAFK
jgi:hypothetical protein